MFDDWGARASLLRFLEVLNLVFCVWHFVSEYRRMMREERARRRSQRRDEIAEARFDKLAELFRQERNAENQLALEELFQEAERDRQHVRCS